MNEPYIKPCHKTTLLVTKIKYKASYKSNTRGQGHGPYKTELFGTADILYIYIGLMFDLIRLYLGQSASDNSGIV